MTARIFLKLVAGIALLIALAVIPADIVATNVMERYFVDQVRRDLEREGRILILSRNVLEMTQASVRDIGAATGIRITVIAADGTVRGDSEADPRKMENHRDRPEVREAFGGAVGSSTRPSATLGMDFLYVAIPIQGGALRLARPLATVQAEISIIRRRVLISTFAVFLPAVLLAAFFSRRLAHRLSDIINYAGELARSNFTARLANTRGGELGLLSSKLNETGEQLARTMQQLQLEHSELEKVERIRKDFVINVSHELRTPLASIQGYTETLIDGAIYDRENNLRFLNIIRHSAERLTRLTADLLTLSRLELRTQEFRLASFRANDLLADVVDTIRPIAAKKNIRLIHEPGPAECEVFCDSEAFYQIVSNLLDNAVKYTPEGGAITAGSRPVQRPDGSEWIEYFVRDTGMGIPPEDQARLFERFYRVDKARSRELGGTGLGLAIVKHLVRAHGGEVRVESEIGVGSVFFFTMPVDHVEIDSLDETATLAS